MKIALFTFIDYRNYGNRLQNYAVQKYLQDKGLEVETIMHDKYCDYRYTSMYAKRMPLHILKSFFWLIYDLIKKDNHALGYIWQSDELDKIRIKSNRNFTDKYINESNFIIHEGNHHKNRLKRYDLAVVGSDQVWNPTMRGAAGNIYFLRDFEKKKRVAFSASVGVKEVPNYLIKQWTKYVQGMGHISVREQSAKDLISAYTTQKVTVLLDPTMLVDVGTWKKIADNKKTSLPLKYIAVYVLGDLSAKEQDQIRKLALKMQCEIVELNNKKNREYYSFDAADFINSIQYSEMVITDSFHACVFSILFGKEFYVRRRTGEYDDIYSRIEDLLNKFDIHNCEIENLTDITNKKQIMNTDYVNKVLERERHVADCYWNEVLSDTYGYEKCE